jgi:hypothetical protein
MKYEGISEKFPGLCVAEGIVRGLEIRPASDELEQLKPEIAGKIRAAYNLDNVKDDPGFRAYRDFFWSVGIDPTLSVAMADGDLAPGELEFARQTAQTMGVPAKAVDGFLAVCREEANVRKRRIEVLYSTFKGEFRFDHD